MIYGKMLSETEAIMGLARKRHDAVTMVHTAELITLINKIDRITRAARRGEYLEE